jgi:hypothetical protein
VVVVAVMRVLGLRVALGAVGKVDGKERTHQQQGQLIQALEVVEPLVILRVVREDLAL